MCSQITMRTLVSLCVALAFVAFVSADGVPRSYPGMRQGSPSAPIVLEMFVDLQVSPYSQSFRVILILTPFSAVPGLQAGLAHHEASFGPDGTQ